jgi:hypothetical protein
MTALDTTVLTGPELSPLQERMRGKRVTKLSLVNRTKPEDELKRLVLEHKALLRQAVKMENAASPHTTKKGVTVPPQFEAAVCSDLREWAKALRKRAASKESLMLQELRAIPVYNSFLKGVWGCGTLSAAYVVAHVDVADPKRTADSLVQFCGLGIRNGHISRPESGRSRDFCGSMRERLYLMLQGMRKSRGLHSKTNKYLEAWDAAKARILLRAVDGKIDGHSAPSFADRAGWHEAGRLFLHDLFREWRNVNKENFNG